MRIHAWRKDLADIGLAGQVFAPHYARPLARSCGAQTTMLRPNPDAQGGAISQLLPGEEFSVLEYAGGWAWGFSAHDHIVGYVEGIALADPIAATHFVCEARAPVTPDGSLASPVIAHLPMGTLLQGHEEGACLDTEYGCVPLSHLRRLDDPEADPVVVAERLLGAPWLDGGRTADGIDAAGLVQLALSLCGVEAPRLLDQLPALGTPVPEQEPARRGDLVLFEDGAGLMVDDLLMIHAGCAAGKVTVEPAAPFAAERRRIPL
ncbi:MAG: C40 family peptidase [Sphingomonadaceae bacterium]|nr:C40 family peptidase [Sphingomonadaceae bacterium]